jgi:hypothetical protein
MKCKNCNNETVDSLKVCSVCSEKHKKRINAYRLKKRQAGLCFVCTQKATIGIYCSKCHAAQKLKVKKWKQLCKCQDCGLQCNNGKSRCDSCLSKRTERKNLCKANGICPRCMKNRSSPNSFMCSACNEKKKSLRKKLSDNGICVSCEKNSAINGSTYCAACLKRHRDRRHNFKKQGLCVKCGSTPAPDNMFCEVCYLKETSYRHFGTTNYFKELKDIWKKQNQKCPYSGLQLVLGSNTELDHVVPKSKGGGLTIKDVQWVYSIVNKMKWDSTEPEFLSLVAKIYNNKVSNANNEDI